MRLADCDDWRAGSVETRLDTIRALTDFSGGPSGTPGGRGAILDQDQAYDLVYRHALDVDAGGDRLVMGSTTGGLWISENGGDRWSTISTHLPPVYQVAFARH